MTLPVRKGYKGAPASAVLTTATTDSNTSFVVDTVVGWATSFPFYCVVEPGTSREEKVKVTAISGTTLPVVRNQDDTNGPAAGHGSSSVIYPVFTADEADEANQIASAMTTKGDLIATDGSSINRFGVGTNTHVLQADSASTNGLKWGQVVEAGIADNAVTAAKIAASAVGNDEIADNAVNTAEIVDGAVTSAKILDGTIVDGDINASAAIALTKLGTGALPTTITVASANVVNGSLLTTDFDTTTAVASGGVPVITVSTSSASGGKNGDVWIVV